MTAPARDAGWPDSLEALVALQGALGRLSVEPFSCTEPGSLVVGGCYVCFPKGKVGAGRTGEPGHAAAVTEAGGTLGEPVLVTGASGAPFVSGALALREGPLLERAVRALPARPDVLLVNATGRDHPRRAGLAVHLGWMLDVPSIGVTQRPLVATGQHPGGDAGATSALLLDGEVVGVWLRTQAGARPLAISAGYRTDVPTATAVVAAAVGSSRTPEPLRRAREAARRARAGQERI